MIKYKYRIKTEQEFLSEFGSNWRNVRCSFSDGMDFMWGQDIDPIYYKHLLNSQYKLDLNNVTLETYNRDNGRSYWQISGEMIKEVRIGIDYNEKRVLVYE